MAISPSYVVPVLGRSGRPTAPSCADAVDLESKRTMTSSAPILKWNYTGIYTRSIVVTDFDGDGKKEVLLFDVTGTIYCLNMTGGLKWRCETASWTMTSPPIADVDADGKLEVLVGQQDFVCCVNSTGSLKWNSRTRYTNPFSPVPGTSPVIADINGDGKPEILVSSGDDRTGDEGISCLNGTTGVWVWNYTEGIAGTIAVGDIDGDGKQEVLAGVKPSNFGPNGTWHLNIVCLNSTGGLKWIWNGPDRGVSLDPAVFDVDGDGKLEVIVACSVLSSLAGGVYCLNGVGGLKWNYTTQSSESAMACPVVSDVDGDGKQEIVVDTQGNTVYCLNGTGALEWKGWLGGFWHHTWTLRFPPIVADLNGDGCQEIIGIPDMDPTVRCLDGKTGEDEWSYTAVPEGFLAQVDLAFAVSDVQGDGQRNVVTTDLTHGNITCLSSTGAAKWNYSIGESIFSPPVAADVDGDHKSEVIVCSSTGKIYCLGFPSTPAESGSYYSLILAASLVVVVGLAIGLTFVRVVMVRRRTLRTTRLQRKGTCFPRKV
jgi:hypothetical protein